MSLVVAGKRLERLSLEVKVLTSLLRAKREELEEALAEAKREIG